MCGSVVERSTVTQTARVRFPAGVPVKQPSQKQILLLNDESRCYSHHDRWLETQYRETDVNMKTVACGKELLYMCIW